MNRLVRERFVVRVLTEHDWSLLRSIRLAALENAPEHLVGDLWAERARRERDWRREVAADTWLVAERAGQLAGLVKSVADPADRPDERWVGSLWVVPQFRRQGVARMLIDAVRHFPYESGLAALRVWVLEGNQLARKLYLGMNFRETGIQALAPDGVRREDQFELRLRALEQDSESDW